MKTTMPWNPLARGTARSVVTRSSSGSVRADVRPRVHNCLGGAGETSGQTGVMVRAVAGSCGTTPNLRSERRFRQEGSQRDRTTRSRLWCRSALHLIATGQARLSFSAMPKPILTDRPLRVAMVGIGKIFELTSRTYEESEDAEIVALCDRDEDRLGALGQKFPKTELFASIEDLLGSGLELDMVEIGVPTPLHCDVACQVLRAGCHVNLQKPMATSLAEADEMIAAACDSGAVLRVMEPYLFFQPLEVLKEIVESGEIGEVAGFHMKMVGTGGGGWDVPWSTMEWQFQQMEEQGLGILVFDDGWHKFSVARWLFGPVVEVMAWIGRTELGPGIAVGAPSTIMWNHASGVRGVFDLTLAPDTYMRSDYYSSDERFEVTGTRGFVRVNHCAAFGLQQPSLEVYRDGVIRAFHNLDDDWGTCFIRQTEHYLRWLRFGGSPLLLDAEWSREILAFVLGAVDSSRRNVPVRLDTS